LARGESIKRRKRSSIKKAGEKQTKNDGEAVEDQEEDVETAEKKRRHKIAMSLKGFGGQI